MLLKHDLQIISITEEMHHCATVVSTPIGPVVAGYVGQECTDDQRVFIWHNDKHITLESKTGNPVLWEENGKLLLLYSIFRDKDYLGNTPANPVQRWMYCDNYVVDIMISPSTIALGEPQLVENGFGLLGRCTPIKVDGVTLVPMYRERNPQCEIWEYKNDRLQFRSQLSLIHDNVKIDDIVYGSLGRGVAIQPTLFKADQSLIAFCRNVTRNYTHAWKAVSEDDGLTWSPLVPAPIVNYNSSLVIIDGLELAIFNPTRDRNPLLMFNIKTRAQIILGQIPVMLEPNLRRSFSYPNYCFGHTTHFLDKQYVYIVHTYTDKIALHKFSLDYLKYFLG